MRRIHRLLSYLFLVVIASGLSGRLQLAIVPLDQRFAVASRAIVVARTMDRNQKEYKAYPTSDGYFAFGSIENGPSYLISVYDSEYRFPEVVVVTYHNRAAEIHTYEPTGAQAAVRLRDLTLAAIEPMSFFPPKQDFDALQFLRNPMVLFGLGAMGLMTFLTRMQSSLDPADQVGRAAENTVNFDRLMRCFNGQPQPIQKSD